MSAALNSCFLSLRMVYLTAYYKQLQIILVHLLSASGQAVVSRE